MTRGARVSPRVHVNAATLTMRWHPSLHTKKYTAAARALKGLHTAHSSSTNTGEKNLAQGAREEEEGRKKDYAFHEEIICRAAGLSAEAWRRRAGRCGRRSRSCARPGGVPAHLLVVVVHAIPRQSPCAACHRAAACAWPPRWRAAEVPPRSNF